MREETVVMYDSPEAATFVTGISGWKSRDGFFWGKDEHMARYSGSTHKKCDECGRVYSKHSYCDFCHEKKETEKYYALPVVEWDEETPIYDDSSDEYYFDKESLMEDMYWKLEEANKQGCEPEIRLLLCDPVHLHLLESDIWEDELPEDGELSGEVSDALDALNAVIKAQPPSSWYPGKKRINMEPLWAELKADLEKEKEDKNQDTIIHSDGSISGHIPLTFKKNLGNGGYGE